MVSQLRTQLRQLAAVLVGLLTIVYLNLVWMSMSCNSSDEFLHVRNQNISLPIADHDGDDDEQQYKPLLLARARPMVLLKKNIPMSTVYNYPERQFSGECSCLNPKSSFECCQRTFRRSHKMGCVMSKDLLLAYPNQYRLAAEPRNFTYMERLPDTDYRDVIVLRNIYSSLISGYLYHFKGFECGMPDKIADFLGQWDSFLSFPLNPPRGNLTLCQYMQRTKRKTSVRAYIDWVMRYYYSGMFSHWALAQEIPEVRDRTLIVCYEDLLSPNHDLKTVHSIVDFFFNGTPPTPWEGIPPGHVKYEGGHSTRHDPDIKDRLMKIIKKLDKKYYNGEIAWVNSVLPC